MTETTETKVRLCSICDRPIPIELNGWAYGHNAEPVNSGRCCGDCNSMVVIPMRLRRMGFSPRTV
jgi:hypothetical protein